MMATPMMLAGLWGGNNSGTITASFVIPAFGGGVDSGNGNNDRVGGLVGSNSGTITASYASGDATGGDGGDNVGGLVGVNSGTITASYATGTADGGNGDSDSAGSLLGSDNSFLFGNMVTASYGFGTQMGGETAGVDRSGDASPAVVGASQLTADNSSTEMDNRWSARVWNFGTARQNPRLKWITGFDSSGATDVLKYPCERTLLPSGQSCGGVIPGQDSSLLADGDGDNVPDTIDVDDDNDGLIEIRFLEDLDYVRHSLAGTSYKPGASATAHTIGAPAGGLKGYELARSLDFDEDGSYRSGRVNTVWTNGAGPNTGWSPIGDSSSNAFNAIFDGNGHTIGDLRIARQDTDYIGLFGAIGGSGEVRSLALSNAQVDYTGSSDDVIYIGTVAGQSSGTMRTVSSIGLNSSVDGGDDDFDFVGGLVGRNEGGTITASYAHGAVDGGDGDNDVVGGLVGHNNNGTITASYASGAVDGSNGNNDNVGGLVGGNGGTDGGTGVIVTSYATGDVDGGAGNNDRVGGLVGLNIAGTTTASYGFGTKVGGELTTNTVDRSSDASPASAVANAAALTATNSSVGADGIDGNTDDNDWSATVWNFGATNERPVLKWVTASNFSCDRNLLPSGQSCGGIIPGQNDRIIRAMATVTPIVVDNDVEVQVAIAEALHCRAPLAFG